MLRHNCATARRVWSAVFTQRGSSGSRSSAAHCTTSVSGPAISSAPRPFHTYSAPNLPRAHCVVQIAAATGCQCYTARLGDAARSGGAIASEFGSGPTTSTTSSPSTNGSIAIGATASTLPQSPVWSRVAAFMSSRRFYLLYGEAVRPAPFTMRH